MSLTFTGIITILLTQFLGDNVASGDIEAFINVFGLIIGAAVAWYGRYRHGDITWYGSKV